MGEKPLKPVYLIYGDTFQVEEALGRLKKRIGASGASAGEGAGHLNVVEFDAGAKQGSGAGGEGGGGGRIGAGVGAAALQAAGTIPFFGETQLVIVRRADKLSKADQDMLTCYVENPSPAAVMVLAAEKFSKNTSLYKAVNRMGGAHEYRAPTAGALQAWVQAEFAEEGKMIAAPTARRLINMVGTDQAALRQEIKKLAAYGGEQTEIAEQDVDEVATRNPETDIFKMVDALGHRRVHEALTEVNRLMFNGEPPQRIMGMIARQFRIIIKMKALDTEGGGRRLGPGEAAGVLGVRPFLVARYRAQAENFSMDELRGIYKLLRDADVDMKTGRREPALALEMLIAAIADDERQEARGKRKEARVGY